MENKVLPYTLELVEKLRFNAHLNKHAHFNASKRHHRNHILVGVPLVIISVLLSVMLSSTQNGTPQGMTAFIFREEWVGAMLALCAATLSAIQAFFNFEKQCEGHRQAGNQYLFIARENEKLIASYSDGLENLGHLVQQYDLLNRKYCEISKVAESFSVSDRDYQKARRFQDRKSQIEGSLYQRVKEAFPSNKGTVILKMEKELGA